MQIGVISVCYLCLRMRKFIFIILIFISGKIFSQIIDSLPNDSLKRNRNVNFLPIPIIMHSPETYWGFGAGGVLTFSTNKKDTSLRTSSVQALVLYTLNEQFVCVTENSIYFPKEKFILKLHGSFSKYPDKFWGIGNNSTSVNEENYTYTQYYFHPEAIRKIFNGLFLGLSYEAQNVLQIDYNAKGLFDTENVTGKNGGKISGLGGLIVWDKRNSAFSPDKGGYVRFSASHYNYFLGSDFDYSSYSLDIRKYLKIIRRQVLVFQGLWKSTTGEVPFRSMSTIGGSNLMRGYYEGRFRDKDMLAFQGEYRTPLWRRLGAVIFSGIGEVSERIKYYSISGFKYTFGGGIRFALKKKDRLNLRLDYGRGKNSDGVYFYLSEAF